MCTLATNRYFFFFFSFVKEKEIFFVCFLGFVSIFIFGALKQRSHSFYGKRLLFTFRRFVRSKIYNFFLQVIEGERLFWAIIWNFAKMMNLFPITLQTFFGSFGFRFLGAKVNESLYTRNLTSYISFSQSRIRKKLV